MKHISENTSEYTLIDKEIGDMCRATKETQCQSKFKEIRGCRNKTQHKRSANACKRNYKHGHKS